MTPEIFTRPEHDVTNLLAAKLSSAQKQTDLIQITLIPATQESAQ